MKKMIAAMLCGTLLMTMLTGCGSTETVSDTSEQAAEDTGTNDADEGTSEEVQSDTESSDAAQAAIDERKAEAEESGEYEKIVISFFDWTGAPAGIDRINEAISAHTEETLGLDVELMIIDSAAYSDDIKLMLSSGEQVDIFSTCGPGYTTCVNNGYVLDLEEDDMMAKYGQGISEKVREEYLDACRIGDVLYGIPPIKDYAIQTAAVCIGTEYLDAIGGDYYGTLLDSTNSLTVEDVYSSDLFKEWCQRAYDWNQAGYISKDALTDDTGASAKVKSGAYLSMMACCKPGYQTQITGECGRDMTVLDVGESFMSSSSVSSFPWCINQNTEDPVAAMQVLDALYTDSMLENLVCWGQEGVEYTVQDDQTITYADGIDSNNSEYYPNVLWMMPNPYVAHVWEGDSLDIGQQISDFNDNCENKSLALGFTWDNSDYASEFTALENAYDQYGTMVTYGFVEPEQGISDLETALQAAGLDDYMAAKQTALDTWASENNIQ